MTSQFKARCSQWTLVKTESEFKIKRTGFEDRERKGERRKVCFISSRSHVLYPFGWHETQITNLLFCSHGTLRNQTSYRYEHTQRSASKSHETKKYTIEKIVI